MVKWKQDRVPGQTLTRSSALEGSDSPASTTFLNIAIWTSIDVRPSDMDFWSGSSPAASLVHDVVMISGGILEPPRSPVLSARYPDALAAILAARRLQWALDGLAEPGPWSGTAAAILIESTPNPDPELALQSAAPGQIVLAGVIAEAVGQLPGLIMSAQDARGWRELQWRHSEAVSTQVTDEQELLRQIKALGREDPGPPSLKPNIPEPIPASVPAGTPNLPEKSEPGDLISARPARDFPAFRGDRRWLMFGGAAAVIALIGILTIAGLVHKSPANHPTPVAVAPAQAQPSNSGATSFEPASKQPTPPNQVKESGSHPRPKPPEPRPQATQGRAAGSNKERSSASCDFTEREIARSLEFARSYLHQGKLYDARSYYQRVSGCPSAREEAQAGLNDVKRKMAIQGLPDQQE